MPKQVVRVATSNNFNCTDKEWKQLNHIANNHLDKEFFINSNINTPKLLTVANHPYKIVVTANPNVTISGESEIIRILSRLKKIKSKIAFVRVKYIPNQIQLFAFLVMTLLQKGYPVVVTLQRFNSKKTLTKYTSLKYYEYSCSRYRLAGKELKYIISVIRKCRTQGLPVWICDQSGKGCQDCKLCSTLTTGQDLKISSLNLSSSGICPYNCPDCYAKTMQNFSKALGHKPMVFDTIRQNDKQAGKTKHILNHKG